MTRFNHQHQAGRKAAMRRKNAKRDARSCTGKQQHAAREAAVAALLSLADDTGATTLNAYRCGTCRGWHVGNRR